MNQREALARPYGLLYLGVDTTKTPPLLTWTAVNESGDHRCGSMELVNSGRMLTW
jgi:hypothetical protein